MIKLTTTLHKTGQPPLFGDITFAEGTGISLTQTAQSISIAVDASGVDHGGLAGLADDDHTQYLLANGTRALTGNWDIGEDRRILTEAIRARDGEGIFLEDDAGNVLIDVMDGGNVVVIGTSSYEEPYSGFSAQVNKALFIRQPVATASTTPSSTIILSNNQTDTIDGNIGSISFMNEAETDTSKRVVQILAQTDGNENSGKLILRTFLAGTAQDVITLASDKSVAFTGEVSIAQTSTSGNSLDVTRNLASTSTDSPVVTFVQDNISDDQTLLRGQQDGTGSIVDFYDGVSQVFNIPDGGGAIVRRTTDGALLDLSPLTLTESSITHTTGFNRVTDDNTVFLTMIRSVDTGTMLGAGVSGDTFRRVVHAVDGTITWGSGSATRDTTLYRSAANTLKTDDSFIVSQENTTGNALQVIRNLTATSTDSPLVNFVQDHTGDDQVVLRIQSDGTGDIVNIFDGATEVVTVLDGGFVGIGQTTPAYPLDILVTSAASTREAVFRGQVSDASGDAVYISNGTITDGIFAPSFTGHRATSATGNAFVLAASVLDTYDSGTAALMTFQVRKTNGDPLNGTLSAIATRTPLFTWTNLTTLLMSLDLSGRLGIGNITPTAQLHVSQASTTGEALRVIRNLTATSTDSPLVNLIQDHASDDQVLIRGQQDGTGDILNLFDGATEVVTVLDGGDVGINATAPGFKLEVGGDATFGDATDSAKDGIVRIRRDADPVLLFYDGDNTTIDGRLQATTTKIMFTSADGVTDHLTVETDTGDVGIATNTPSARLHVLQGTLGNEVFRIESTATNDDVSERVFQSRGTTTNATPATLFTVPITASNTYVIEAQVIARRTGGAAGTADDGAAYVLKSVYTTKTGTVTLMGPMENIIVEDVAGYAAALVISGTNVIVQVTGVANTNITWHATIRTWQVGS